MSKEVRLQVDTHKGLYFLSRTDRGREIRHLHRSRPLNLRVFLKNIETTVNGRVCPTTMEPLCTPEIKNERKKFDSITVVTVSVRSLFFDTDDSTNKSTIFTFLVLDFKTTFV